MEPGWTALNRRVTYQLILMQSFFFDDQPMDAQRPEDGLSGPDRRCGNDGAVELGPVVLGYNAIHDRCRQMAFSQSIGTEQQDIFTSINRPEGTV